MPRDHDLLTAAPARTVREVIDAVAIVTGLPVSVVVSRARDDDPNATAARHLAMWLAVQLTDAEMIAIGHAFGGRSARSVRNACTQIEWTDDVKRWAQAVRERLSAALERPVPRQRPVGWRRDSANSAEKSSIGRALGDYGRDWWDENDRRFSDAMRAAGYVRSNNSSRLEFFL